MTTQETKSDGPAVRSSALLWGRVLNFVLGHKCANCGERHLEFGYYSRAWNTLCEQAAGESGHYCLSCHTIHFATPDFDVWLSRQPRWIRPYNSGVEQRTFQSPLPTLAEQITEAINRQKYGSKS